MALPRNVYVISDLHLGGAYGGSVHADDRGFRLCSHVTTATAFVEALSERSSEQRTELIINGDFVDFLVEQRPGDGPQWTPFVSNAEDAAKILKSIAARDRPFFRALTEFLERGHRLVLLLGNHDLELSLPLVRQTLVEELQVSGCHDFEFIYDGEAYIVGDAVIEHGNQYDEWNRVDHGSLRKLRSWQSRHPTGTAVGKFRPPPGSYLVSEVINPIKADYRFVDLLKPETEVVLPLLLALEPGYRRMAGRLAALCVARVARSMRSTVTGDMASTRSSESFGGDLAATFGEHSRYSGRRPTSYALYALLEHLIPGQSALFLASLDEDVGSDIAAGHVVNRALGLIRLISASKQHLLERRMPALRLALGVLQQHRTFDRTAESMPEYLEAAKVLAGRGFRFVIFGHTHLARDVQLGGGARYLNTGTWADVIQFPAGLLSSGKEDDFRKFVADMSAGAVSRWVKFLPSYVRLDVNDKGHVARAVLVDYRLGDPV